MRAEHAEEPPQVRRRFRCQSGLQPLLDLGVHLPLLVGGRPAPQIGQLGLQPALAANRERLVDRFQLGFLRVRLTGAGFVEQLQVMIEGRQHFARLLQAHRDQPQIGPPLVLLIDQGFQFGGLGPAADKVRPQPIKQTVDQQVASAIFGLDPVGATEQFDRLGQLAFVELDFTQPSDCPRIVGAPL